ncbi:MAG: 50S ribosomal protein L15 [Acidobacteriota bacterium]
MDLAFLKPENHSIKKRKRVGRGPGSGHGRTSGRGTKGQKSIAGYSRKRRFEGGQMPLHRRIPKRGFTNIFKKEWQIINLDRLSKLGLQEINHKILYEKGVIKKPDVLIKILGDGEIKRKITVYANNFSKNALKKIKKAGGKAIII